MTGRVPNVYAATIIPIPFATLALLLRLKARRMTKMGMGYDDLLSIAAWFFAVAYSADLLVWTTQFKLGHKLESYSDDRIEYYLEKSHIMLWASEFLYSWSIVLSKLAVLSFYRRVFHVSSIRIPIIVLMVACVIWIILRTFLTIFHCIPTQAYWDKSIEDARCLTNITKFYLGTDLTHCLMDFIILGLPIFEVARMKLPFGQKIAVIALFATGSLVGVASIFQIVESQQYTAGSREMPYEFALAMIWANVEVHLAVFTSCMALLRPIFRKIVPGLSSGNTYPASRASRPSIAFHPSSGFRSSARDEETRETGASRGFTYHEYDAASLPGSKDNNSRSSRGFVHHEEYPMSSLPGSQDNDSRCSQSSV